MTTDLTSRLAAIIQELTAPQVVEVKAARYVRVALSKDQALGYASNFENTPISPGNTPVGKYTCETVLQELNCKRLTNTTYWSKS